MNDSSTPRTDIAFLRRRIKPGQAPTAPAGTQAGTQTGAQPGAQPGAQARQPAGGSRPAGQQSAGLNLSRPREDAPASAPAGTSPASPRTTSGSGPSLTLRSPQAAAGPTTPAPARQSPAPTSAPSLNLTHTPAAHSQVHSLVHQLVRNPGDSARAASCWVAAPAVVHQRAGTKA